MNFVLLQLTWHIIAGTTWKHCGNENLRHDLLSDHASRNALCGCEWHHLLITHQS